jgi:hypothetical protein
MKSRQQSIRRKLTRVIILTTSVSLLLACAGVIGYEWTTFRQSLLVRVTTLAEVIGSSCTAALSFADESEAESNLILLSAGKHIVGACIRDSNGELLATYSREGE